MEGLEWGGGVDEDVWKGHIECLMGSIWGIFITRVSTPFTICEFELLERVDVCIG